MDISLHDSISRAAIRTCNWSSIMLGFSMSQVCLGSKNNSSSSSTNRTCLGAYLQVQQPWLRHRGAGHCNLSSSRFQHRQRHMCLHKSTVKPCHA